MQRFRDEIMPIAARQLLMAGVTTVRDLGAPLEDILARASERIEKGEIPGPRLFVSGPFIQKAPYFEYEKFVRWGVDGADDARAKVQKLIDAGVDFIKLIDQDQMTDAEVAAVVETAHKAGKPVVAHAPSRRRDPHRPEARRGLLRAHRPRHLAGLSGGHPGRAAQAQQHALLVPDDRGPAPRRIHRTHLPRAPRRSRLAEGHAAARSPPTSAARSTTSPRSTTSRSPSAACRR